MLSEASAAEICLREPAAAPPLAADLIDWLLHRALPLWARHGVDRAGGGFFEKLDLSCRPVEEPRRARLVARQIYCFSIAHELGWDGPAREIVRHGLDFLASRLLKADGTVVMASSADGAVVRRGSDPYDYAFVLFGLASAARRLADRGEMHEIAMRVRERLVADLSHPQIGFEGGSPRTLVLKSNPHMHLLEAFLAWHEVVGAAEPSWRAHAMRMVELARSRLIAPGTGALGEVFDRDWRPFPDEGGLTVEPGHQFEWSWLLGRWALIAGERPVFEAAARLAEIGEEHGVDRRRGVVIDALDERLRPRDGRAKLWPQTERIKAWDLIARHPFASPALRERARIRVPRAIRGLAGFLAVTPAGLWREALGEDGAFVTEPVRASSLYHITCAIHALQSGLPASEEPH